MAQAVIEALPWLARLDPEGRHRLVALASRFLASREIIGMEHLEVDPHMRAEIALQACLPVLELGLDWLRGLHTVVIYPDAFVSHGSVQDDAGLVHEWEEVRAGEAWDQGPMVLSWRDVTQAGPGFNVIVHEVAHKLDLLNGDVNGFPPLHADMPAARWSSVFSTAFAALGEAVERAAPTAIDPYAAEDPGEFFAVVSEAFFTDPNALAGAFPDLYRELVAFYRQDPRAA